MTTHVRGTAGFTLLELVVAMAVTGVVLSVAVTGLQNLSDASDGVSLTTDLNVNLRSTLNLITRDLISAGGRNIPVGGIPVPSGAGAVAIVRPSPDDDMTFPAGATIPAVTPGDGQGPRTGGPDGGSTDTITILMTDSTLPLDSVPLEAIAEDGTTITVDASVPIDGASDGVASGDLIWLRNGLGNTLLMATAREGQTVHFDEGDPMHLNQTDVESGSIAQLLGEPGSGAPPTTATRVLMITYYVDASDPDRPRLMRRVNLRPPRVIGVVVENLQLTYDLVDGATNPTNVADPTNPNQIRKANLFLAGRSHREWRRTHSFLRTSVAAQISLRSLSFVDRYQ